METAAQVQLVFRGEVLHGFHVDDVKRALGERLRIDENGLANLFTAPRTVLKRAVAPTEAARYIATFAKLGAILHAEGLAAPPVSPPPARSAAALPLPTIVPPPEHVAPPPATVRSGPPAPAPIPAATRPLALAPTPDTPVAAAVEPEEVVCPNCNERQTKRLLCRACSTNIEMGLAAKAEADAAARAQALADRQRKYGIKTGIEPVADTSDAPRLWGLRFDGRLARLPYWTGSFVVLTVLYLLLVLLVQRPDTGRWILMGVGVVAVFLVSLRWTAMRLHDLNASGWWSVVLLVPYVGSAASLVLSFVPGTTGDNNYGEPPREGNWHHFGIAAGVFVLTVALTCSSLLSGWLRMQMDDDDGLESLDEPAASVTSAEHLLPAGPARTAYETVYATAPGFKAFASSTSGPWGWSGGASTLSRATAAAMQHCEAARRSEQAPCEILDASAQ